MKLRTVLVAAAGLCAVGGAYYAGAAGQRHADPAPAAVTPAPAAGPDLVDGLIVPSGLKVGVEEPTPNIKQPAGVLFGEVKVPADLLAPKAQPPAGPEIVAPTLPK